MAVNGSDPGEVEGAGESGLFFGGRRDFLYWWGGCVAELGMRCTAMVGEGLCGGQWFMPVFRRGLSGDHLSGREAIACVECGAVYVLDVTTSGTRWAKWHRADDRWPATPESERIALASAYLDQIRFGETAVITVAAVLDRVRGILSGRYRRLEGD